MLGVHRDADAGPDDEVVVFDAEGALERQADLLGGVLRTPLADFRQQDRELVAAEPRDGARVAQDRRQAQRHLLEDIVADLMAEGVVDLLEPIEIHHQQGEGAAAAARRADPLLEAVLQQQAVRQVREGVVKRLVFDGGLLVFGRGDVAQRARHPHGTTLFVAQHAPAQHDPGLVAALVAQAELGAEQGTVAVVELVRQRLLEGVTKIGVRLAEQ